jgi:hypothetical protein
MPTLTLAKNPPELVVRGRKASRIPRTIPSLTTDRWFLVHTKSRQEKVVAQTLRSHQQGYDLPLEKYSTLSARRTITAARPMFSGYLFAYGLPEILYDVYQIPGRPIVSLTQVKDPKLLVQQLATLYALTSHQNPHDRSLTFHCTQQYQIGTYVEFTWPSPLQGQRANILRQQGNLIQVNVGMLGAAVFEVDLTKHPIKILPTLEP